MKRLLFIAGTILASGMANATYFQAPEMADPKIENPDSTGFKFTDVKIIPTTSVKASRSSSTAAGRR